MHLPSIDPGVRAFIWSLLLALYIWIGLLAIGISKATALIIGLLSLGAIFLFVRRYGEDSPSTY